MGVFMAVRIMHFASCFQLLRTSVANDPCNCQPVMGACICFSQHTTCQQTQLVFSGAAVAMLAELCGSLV